MRNYKFFLLLGLSLLFGCATHTNIEPAGKDNIKGFANFGGPIIEAFGTNIPIPYLSVGADYGLTKNMDVNANLHLISLAYQIGGLDLGYTYFPLLNDSYIPTVGINFQIMSLFSFKTSIDDRFRAYPSISPSFAWKLFDGKIYMGSDFVLPVTKLDYYSGMPTVIISPFIGYSWNLGKNDNFFTEIKWNGANVRTDRLAVSYLHPAKSGAVGLYLTLERSF